MDAGPRLQVALDHENLARALTVAREAVAGGVDYVEAGTPLIKSEGLEAVRTLRREFPDATIVADMKVADAGRLETECAAKAGADIVHVLGTASDATVTECVVSAERYDARIVVDLLGVGDISAMIARAREVEQLGVSGICVHTPIDLQMLGQLPFDDLKALAAAVAIPIAVAGGINSENAAEAVKCGASVIIVGGAITKAPDAKAAVTTFKEVLQSGVSRATEHFKRFDEEGIADVLKNASCADISDALHSGGVIRGIRPVVPGVKLVGRALTVWAYPGDWSKTVQAIDAAEPGQVIVIDSGGKPPAVWGEKATMSCIQRGLAGVVIDGGIRDTANIREMKFPAFASVVTPDAGEPRGQGMINVPIEIGGQRVRTGDWIVGDDDGVVVIPTEKAVDIANRAQSVVERENREMSEIEQGSTLAKVAELEKWEQQGKRD